MDGSAGAVPQPWFATLRFDDAADLARALQGSGVDYVPLEAGRYESELTIIACGDMVVQRAADRAHVTRGALDRGTVALLFPLHQQAPPSVNGWQSDGHEGLLLGAGSDVYALCPGTVDWASLLLPAATAQALTELGGFRDTAARPGATLRLPQAVIAPLQRAVLAAGPAIAAAGHAGAGPGLAEALSASLTDHVLAAFAAAQEVRVPRATRDALRLFTAAEAVIDADRGRPMLTADLCARLGVAPRTLHNAFVATAGMSPQAYLRRRRLMMVHVALKDGGSDAGLVKSVALAHGFWHLGHFARAYRDQFGQAPSETLADARGGAYRRAVVRGGLPRGAAEASAL